MRILSLELFILLLIISCDKKQNRFDVKSQDFNRKSSHHYSSQFSDINVINDEDEKGTVEQIDESKDDIALDLGYEYINPSSDSGILSGFLNIFSSTDDKIDSLDRVINDCEEKLYMSTDETNSKQSAINALITERNYLLKQLDSLQTSITQSKRISSKRLSDLEVEQEKLRSLIKILSSEIE